MKSSIALISGAFISSLFILVSSVFAFASDELPSDLIGELYTMRSVYHAEYAPAAWKKKFANYDLETEFNKAVDAVKANPGLNAKDAREIFKSFIYAMRDYHTSVSFTSTESATLPFTIKGAGDRYFIVYINRAKLSEDSFPFHVGDELITADGQPIAQAVAAVQAQTIANVPGTDRGIAEIAFTSRRAARGISVPQGPIVFGIKRHGSDKVSEIQLIWEYTPEKIKPRTTLTSSTDLTGDLTDDQVAVGSSVKHRSPLFHPMMNVDLVDKSGDSRAVEESPYSLGTRKSFTPALGVKVWESQDTDVFHAYIFKTEDRKLIGYVRIPQYEAADYPAAIESFAKIITLFESSTDSMVIDQVNNPGGSIYYLYALVSMLSDQPFKTALHRMSVTQSDVNDALDTIKDLEGIKTDEDAKKKIKPGDLDGYPASYEFVQFTISYARFIISEWNAGHKLTNPYWIGGVEQINSAPVHYTKPILLLTNHMDFSGGDFFPATLQDNHRVTILGSRTAGAGGYVHDVQVPNNVGVNAFRVTESIAERVDGNPIENLGVKPDIEYEFTAEDLAGNYAPYVKAIQAALGSITK